MTRRIPRDRISALLGAALVASVLAGCTDARQQALIDTYSAPRFGASQSSLTRGQVMLETELEIGRAYEVTGKRIEFATVRADAEPPIDDRGELTGFRLINAEAEERQATVGRDSAVRDSGVSTEPAETPAALASRTLRVRVPFRQVRQGALYYRWVVEYASRDGERVSMRKSEIYRTSVEQARTGGADTPVSGGP